MVRRSLWAGMALAACLTAGPRVHAQMAVFDASNFGNTLNTVQNGLNQLAC